MCCIDSDSLFLELYNTHLDYTKKLCLIKQKNMLNIRLPGIPDHISEYICSSALCKYLSIKSKKSKSGDLITENKTRIECKTFTSDAPISFGPLENWDFLILLDAKSWIDGKFTLYKINISKKKFGYIKVNKNESYNNQCSQKRRPRITFNNLIKQINKKFIERIEFSICDII